MVELACITLVDIGLGRGKGTWETNCFFDSSKGIGLQPIGAVSPVGMSDVGLFLRVACRSQRAKGRY